MTRIKISKYVLYFKKVKESLSLLRRDIKKVELREKRMH